MGLYVRIRWMAALQVISGNCEGALYGMGKTAGLGAQPGRGISGGFGGDPIVHGLIDFGNAHGFTLFQILKFNTRYARFS